MRLRIRTEGVGDSDWQFPITGANVKVTLAGSRTHNPYEGEARLEGVESVTIVCRGRQHPVRAVLVVRDVHLDLEAEVDEAMVAAIRLAGATEEA